MAVLEQQSAEERRTLNLVRAVVMAVALWSIVVLVSGRFWHPVVSAVVHVALGAFVVTVVQRFRARWNVDGPFFQRPWSVDQEGASRLRSRQVLVGIAMGTIITAAFGAWSTHAVLADSSIASRTSELKRAFAPQRSKQAVANEARKALAESREVLAEGQRAMTEARGVMESVWIRWSPAERDELLSLLERHGDPMDVVVLGRVLENESDPGRQERVLALMKHADSGMPNVAAPLDNKEWEAVRSFVAHVQEAEKP